MRFSFHFSDLFFLFPSVEKKKKQMDEINSEDDFEEIEDDTESNQEKKRNY